MRPKWNFHYRKWNSLVPNGIFQFGNHTPRTTCCGRLVPFLQWTSAKKPPEAAMLAHQSFPAQQLSLRLLSDTLPMSSSPGLWIPLARLALCGHLARRPGRRPYRHAPAQGDRAAPLRPPPTQALRRRAEGGAADAPLDSTRGNLTLPQHHILTHHHVSKVSFTMRK